ncbi:MAG: hypothetical protein U0V87_10390 [Acidobacteriota bacterium]
MSKKLIDADGGMQRMAIGLDWNRSPEKLLDRNARMLDLLTLQFRRSGRKSDREQLLKVAKFITEKLGQADGSFASAVCEGCPGGRDTTVLTDANAMASAALIRAGAVTNETDLVGRGLSGARFLRANRYVRNQGVAHAIEGKGILLPLYLDDLAATAETFFTAYQATGDTTWLRDGGEIVLLAVDNLMDKSLGALRDALPPAGAPAPCNVRCFLWKKFANGARVGTLSISGGQSGGRFRQPDLARAFGSYGGSPRWRRATLSLFTLSIPQCSR